MNWMNVTLRLFQMKKKLHWTDSEFDRTYFLFTIKVVVNKIVLM